MFMTGLVYEHSKSPENISSIIQPKLEMAKKNM